MNLSSVSSEAVESFQQGLFDWAETNLRQFPWRETTDPYEVLVAEILLGATLASKVVPIYNEFLDRYPSPGELSQADEDALASLLEPLGLQNRRAAALKSIGGQIYTDGVPNTEKELLSLPYVGKYAANATLCFAFERDRAIVDDNVARVYRRGFDVDLNPQRDAAWEFAEQLLPTEDVRKYNLALLDFGALICQSGTPRCEDCYFTPYCEYYQEISEGV